MLDILSELKKGKSDFINYFNNKFEETKGNGLKKENEENEVNHREKNKKIQIENKKTRRINMLVSLIFYSTSFVISVFLIYLIKLGVDQSVSPIRSLFYFLALPAIFLAFNISSIIYLLFETSYIKEDQYKPHDIVEIKSVYLNNLKCSMDEIKHYYSILIECLGEEALNKKMIELRNTDEEVGSYTLILKLFNEAIQDEETKIKDDEMLKKLKMIVN